MLLLSAPLLIYAPLKKITIFYDFHKKIKSIQCNISSFLQKLLKNEVKTTVQTTTIKTTTEDQPDFGFDPAMNLPSPNDFSPMSEPLNRGRRDIECERAFLGSEFRFKIDVFLNKKMK